MAIEVIAANDIGESKPVELMLNTKHLQEFFFDRNDTTAILQGEGVSSLSKEKQEQISKRIQQRTKEAARPKEAAKPKEAAQPTATFLLTLS